ncbi:MAG TPA: VOC family protein [Polyangiaceae bacterium]|nr:VOC family protein [Polyangiaceae bacterium]
MTIKAATPYLILNGKADEAIEFYRSTLGAKEEVRLRFGDVDDSCPVAMKQRVMHCALRVGGALVMLSDGPGEGALPPTGIVSVALDFDDANELRRVFDALSASGKVIEKVIQASWGLFAALHDRFGVSWMLNCNNPPA